MKTNSAVSIKSVAVHDGRFHADDVFAVATLVIAGAADLENIIRSRDEEVLFSAGLRVDVGNKYSPESGDFDHHQIGGAGRRDNGVPYAAFGLVWKEYGPGICGGNEELSRRVDKRFVQAVDAGDSGLKTSEPIKGLSTVSASDIIELMNPTWCDEESMEDEAFRGAVHMAVTILDRQIMHSHAQILAASMVREAVASSDGNIVLLDEPCPWQGIIVRESDALYVVSPSSNGKQWSVQCVPPAVGSFDKRKPLPESWAGKRGKELAAITGVADAVFCHTNLFVALAESREGALALAGLAVEFGGRHTSFSHE